MQGVHLKNIIKTSNRVCKAKQKLKLSLGAALNNSTNNYAPTGPDPEERDGYWEREEGCVG